MIRNPLRLIVLAFALSLFAGHASVAAVNDAGPAITSISTDVSTPAPTTPATLPAAAPASPAPATVAPTTPSPAAARLINMLINVLAAILLILAPYFAHRIIALFEKKSGITLAPQTKAKIDALLDQGINYADEQAHKAIKNKEKALTMPEKLEHAAGYVMDLADKAQVEQWTVAKVKKMLESRIQVTRVTNGVTPTTTTTPATPPA